MRYINERAEGCGRTSGTENENTAPADAILLTNTITA